MVWVWPKGAWFAHLEPLVSTKGRGLSGCGPKGAWTPPTPNTAGLGHGTGAWHWDGRGSPKGRDLDGCGLSKGAWPRQNDQGATPSTKGVLRVCGRGEGVAGAWRGGVAGRSHLCRRELRRSRCRRASGSVSSAKKPKPRATKTRRGSGLGARPGEKRGQGGTPRGFGGSQGWWRLRGIEFWGSTEGFWISKGISGGVGSFPKRGPKSAQVGPGEVWGDSGEFWGSCSGF